jgi:hypothetical protein
MKFIRKEFSGLCVADERTDLFITVIAIDERQYARSAREDSGIIVLIEFLLFH